MIERNTDIARVRTALKRSRVVALLGPRQCGKSTLAQQFVSASAPNYFDLEDPKDTARLMEPDSALRPLKGLVVIDEIQRRPELFPLLRVLADRNRCRRGSSSWEAPPRNCSGNPRKRWQDASRR